MNFADGMKKVIKNLDAILAVSELLTPEILEAMHTISIIDMDELGKTMSAIEKIEAEKQMIRIVENGLHDIRGVVEIQNQVKYVSDIRDQIGLVVGSLPQFKELADNVSHIRPILAMQPMIEEVLALSVKMDAVLDLEEEMDHVNMKLELVQDKFNNIEKLNAEATKSAECAANMLNEIKIREKVMDEKLSKMEQLQVGLKDFNVDVTFSDAGSSGFSRFNKQDGTLQLRIPVGIQGEKGDSIRGEQGPQGKTGISGHATNQGEKGKPGRDGKDFDATGYGTMADRSRYNNTVPGTSFVVLDQNPAMVYFRIGNSSGNWTDGQPFGVVQENALNAEKLNGYTLNEILEYVRTKLGE